MSEEEKDKQVSEMKREAVLSRAWRIAREMGATVVYQDFKTGIFTLQIHPASLSMLEGKVFRAALTGGAA